MVEVTNAIITQSSKKVGLSEGLHWRNEFVKIIEILNLFDQSTPLSYSTEFVFFQHQYQQP